jgi:hypothetical protein
MNDGFDIEKALKEGKKPRNVWGTMKEVILGRISPNWMDL